MEFILARLQEKSTVAGIVGLVAAIAGFNEVVSAEITLAVMSLASLAAVILKEKGASDAPEPETGEGTPPKKD
jgi:hypothetical protein